MLRHFKTPRCRVKVTSGNSSYGDVAAHWPDTWNAGRRIPGPYVCREGYCDLLVTMVTKGSCCAPPLGRGLLKAFLQASPASTQSSAKCAQSFNFDMLGESCATKQPERERDS
eukprot:5778093-Amphidinium_carterae.1